MNVSATSGASSAYPVQAAQRSGEAAEAKRAGPDHDGDADDVAKAAASKPSVNINGQKLGQVVNLTA